MATSRIVRTVPHIRDLQVGSLPTALPVFPLPGALLLPRGKLPLNIFEPRYLALVEDALAANRMFGMIQPSAIASERDEALMSGDPVPLYRVGCVGRLVSFNEREDGTFAITLLGLARFHVRGELEAESEYRILSVGYAGFEADLDDPGPVAFDRDALLETLRRFFAHRGFQARWEALQQMDDEALITTISMVCPLPPAEKQALLEAPTLGERARILLALLEMAGHEDEDGGPPHAA